MEVKELCCCVVVQKGGQARRFGEEREYDWSRVTLARVSLARAPPILIVRQTDQRHHRCCRNVNVKDVLYRLLDSSFIMLQHCLRQHREGHISWS